MKQFIVIKLDSDCQWSDDIEISGPFQSETLAEMFINKIIERDNDEFGPDTMTRDYFEIREINKVIENY